MKSIFKNFMDIILQASLVVLMLVTFLITPQESFAQMGGASYQFNMGGGYYDLPTQAPNLYNRVNQNPQAKLKDEPKDIELAAAYVPKPEVPIAPIYPPQTEKSNDANADATPAATATEESADNTGDNTVEIPVATQESHKQKIFFAGSEMGNHGSFGVVTGVIVPLPIQDSSVGNGWVAKLVGSGIGYEYKSGIRTIKARGAGGDLTFGYSESSEKGGWGVYAGPGFYYTRLSPEDFSNKSRGRQWSLNLQVDGERKFTEDYKISGSASYQMFNNNNFSFRTRPLMRVYKNIFVGPEATYQGGNGYRASQFGAVITGIDIGYSTQIGFKAGLQKSWGDSSSGYVGFELGRAF